MILVPYASSINDDIMTCFVITNTSIISNMHVCILIDIKGLSCGYNSSLCIFIIYASLETLKTHMVFLVYKESVSRDILVPHVLFLLTIYVTSSLNLDNRKSYFVRAHRHIFLFYL